MTLGVGDILRARKIVLLITGEGKERVSELLAGTADHRPARPLLALHDDVDVFIDDGSGLLGRLLVFDARS